MSSLTDIIFLLLIFFMLTSSLVAPNALNLKLPGTSRKSSVSGDAADLVAVGSSGNYTLNGRDISLPELEAYFLRKSDGQSEKFRFLIQPERETPVEHVVALMDIALNLQIDGVLLTSPEE